MDTKTILKELENRRITPEQAKKMIKKAQMEKDAIAIIGMSGKYPRANNLDEYWKNLKEGKDCVSEIPKERWDMKKYYSPEIGKKGKIYCKNIGMIENYEYFDPLFFEITPKDAENMDPQHRLFLEESYKAFEDAGYCNQQLNNKKCGVYLGIVESVANMVEGGVSATGSSNAIAASRIAYYLNLKGPAIAVDTACSSSGVALHLATQALHNEEVDMALVGGACLYLKPESYVSMCSTGMLSPSGRCKTFDNDADGFVPGEGVGTLILKRLADAKKDHDHIYGCIIASGLNQDGKTNGITAPNLESQKELVESLYARKQIDPETITYAEFHGTGTKLGDPIELESLSAAFAKKSKKKNFCAIGSVKSNIGHTSAAGTIASIQKLLLCMKHQELVPTLHVKEPNQHFNFQDSPFYINRENKRWFTNGDVPRRACLDSFGFSGTNVHVVLEDYTEKAESSKEREKQWNLFVLSAKNKNQLKTYAVSMLEFLKENSVNLNDFFYTLQTGREPMEERIALIVNGREDLLNKLSDYTEGKTSEDWFYENHLTKNELRLREASCHADRLKQAEAYKNLFHATEPEKLQVVAKQWIRGEIIAWAGILYPEEEPYKMSIPKYPFDEKPYLPDVVDSSVEKVLHPLVHFNISDFTKQCFQSNFTGSEFFIADHKVDGKNLLPGAAMVEMARAAGELSCNEKVAQIKELEWVSPIEIREEGKAVTISLYPEEEEVTFLIAQKENPDLVCAQGKLTLATQLDKPDNWLGLQLEDIRKRCTKKLNGSTIYKEQKGIIYGDSFRGIQNLVYNEKEALALVKLDESYLDQKYAIAPTMLDSALQAVSPFVIPEHKGDVYVPFSVSKIQIFGSLPNEVYVYVSKVNSQSDDEKMFDLRISDTDGKTVLFIQHFGLRNAAKKDWEQEKLVYLKPVWTEENVLKNSEPIVLQENETLLVLGNGKNYIEAIKEQLSESIRENVIEAGYGETFEKVKEASYLVNPSKESDFAKVFEDLEKQGKILSNFIVFPFHEETVQDRIQYSFNVIVNLSNALMNSNSKETFHLLYCIQAYKEEQALSGMFKGIFKEADRFQYKTVMVDSKMNEKELAASLLRELKRNLAYSEVLLKKDKRLVKQFEQIEILPKRADKLAKDGGVYLITGGLGAIGSAVAKYFADNHNVRIVLSGRRERNSKVEDVLRELSSNGSEISYLQADITKREDCFRLVKTVKEQYGKLDGIIHCAGILKDALIWGKSLEDAKEVLAPKIYGTMYLDEAVGEDNLDFMILCSSLASAIGNMGQCDYCYGNSFMDYFAAERNEKRKLGQRSGMTISINWCPWETEGMQVEDDFKAYIKEHNGMVSLQTEDGMQALEDAWSAGLSQILVFKGDERIICKNYIEDKASENQTEELEKPVQEQKQGKEECRVKVEAYLRNMISEQTKIPADDIDAEESFGDYGIDSIVILSLTRAMEKRFGLLSKTLFFEYKNLTKLTEYFLENYKDKFTESSEKKPEVLEGEVKKESKGYRNIKNRDMRTRKLPALNKEKSKDFSEDFAVIGISGRYPMADNLEQFWDNLKNGRDCISEIPKERWDYKQYYDPDKSKNGTMYSKWGGFINDVDKFDPLFFHIPPVEADFMDPQVRISLESAWHAMEDAGYTREKLSNYKVGVYIGVMYGAYQLFKGKIGDAYVPATASYSAIANRISYFFDCHGPSMAVDTMCSSSLTALHLACESMKRGETDMAFVGGVNLSIHPDKYIALSFGKFSSSDGRCRSFGEGGDGYVPGEGVGTIILKPLSMAQKDHDHIYAVVKGSAINSGGKASGFTVPSPAAQSEVINQVYQKTGIDPESVSYIETHGTGTSLGDPIEINGLSKVFHTEKNRKQYCSIGSVKSNIGHLEGAAGIASLTKVILQMQHNQLVPSLHSRTLNPYIDFENSPFYVQQKLSEWKETKYEKGGLKLTAPRRAAISSFGAGGSNAHVLVEQYLEKLENGTKETKETRLYVFSAKTKERLQQYVKQFAEYLSDDNESVLHQMEQTIVRLLAETTGIPKTEFDVFQDIEAYGIQFASNTPLHNWIVQELEQPLVLDELEKIKTIEQLACYLEEKSRRTSSIVSREPDAERIAYTLQTGREPMEQRLAICADSLRKLKEKLSQWLNHDESVGEEHNVLDYKEVLSKTVEEIVNGHTMEELLKQKKYSVLAELWTKGAKINWELMYDESPYKISLPVYPFEKERCWVHTKNEEAKQENVTDILHPVLHQNISTIYGVEFSTVLTGSEPFLQDHHVSGSKVVPGVVYLEMARKAVELAVGELDTSEVISICNLVWLAPAIVEQNQCTINIQLEVENREEMSFTIYSKETEETIYCTGNAVIGEKEEDAFYDLDSIKEADFTDEWEPSEIYSCLKESGLDYGPSFQAIQYLGCKDNQVVALLELDKQYVDDRYVLIPGIADAALHSAIAFSLCHEADGESHYGPMLPLAVDEVTIYEKCVGKMIAVLTKEQSVSGKMNKIDILLLNENGQLCISINGLVTKKVSAPKQKENDCVVFTPKWCEKELATALEKGDMNRSIVMFGANKNVKEELYKHYNSEDLLFLDMSGDDIGKTYTTGAEYIVEQIQKMHRVYQDAESMLQIVILSTGGQERILAGYLGMLKTMQLENPYRRGQILILEDDISANELKEYLEREAVSGDEMVLCKGKKRYTYYFQNVIMNDVKKVEFCRNGGVYLITGGLGGLGMLMAKEIASQIETGTILMTGRSVCEQEQKEKVDLLRRDGITVQYMQTDISKREDTLDLAERIKREYGKLDGIIHCAGVVKDNWLSRKTLEELRTVLKPKVTGLYNLDKAFQKFNLDFVIVMSSTASLKGNMGQSDYAAANGFMDFFAAHWNRLASCGERIGKMYSVNWPLWRDGGMQISDEAEKMIYESTGMVPLETEAAFHSLYQAAGQNIYQFAVLQGKPEKISQWMNPNQ